jgi:AcrR family transcriptional regulator
VAAGPLIEEPSRRAHDPAPPERIVLATIGCVERHGVTGTTVRRIAEEAGVNIAAINYYFGSKERLLETAFAHTLHEGFPKALHELKVFIARRGGDIEAGTVEFFRDYLPQAFSHPRISVAHLQTALLDQDYAGPAVAETRRFVEEFLATVSPAMPQATETGRRLAALHVWATVFTLMMLPELFPVPRESLLGEEMVEQLATTLFRS